MTIAPARSSSPPVPVDPAARRADIAMHLAGLAFCLPAAAMLLFQVGMSGRGLAVSVAAVYALGMLAMFGFSAAYHLASDGRWKDAMRACDHAAIFIMIAGSYTPFAVLAIGGFLGWGLLALVWFLAFLGVCLKLFLPRRWDRASVYFYIALGWIGMPVIGASIEALSLSTLALLGIGGLLYTGGVAFHLWESLRFQNALWHGFVLAAAGCHYVAVVGILT